MPSPLGQRQAFPDRFGEGQDFRRQLQQAGQQLGLVEGRRAETGQQRVVVQQQLVELGGQRFRLGQIADADRAAGHLVLIGRADAAPGRADLAVAPRRLARAVQGRMQRQDQRGVIGDAQRFRRDRQPLRRHPLRFPPAARTGRPRRHCR